MVRSRREFSLVAAILCHVLGAAIRIDTCGSGVRGLKEHIKEVNHD